MAVCTRGSGGCQLPAKFQLVSAAVTSWLTSCEQSLGALSVAWPIYAWAEDIYIYVYIYLEELSVEYWCLWQRSNVDISRE